MTTTLAYYNLEISTALQIAVRSPENPYNHLAYNADAKKKLRENFHFLTFFIKSVTANGERDWNS
jgi:hypothetical protein